jgi:hypothetical protein
VGTDSDGKAVGDNQDAGHEERYALAGGSGKS